LDRRLVTGLVVGEISVEEVGTQVSKNSRESRGLSGPFSASAIREEFTGYEELDLLQWTGSHKSGLSRAHGR
jgi:hypothetical protein